MGKLLKESAFDAMEARQAVISSFVSVVIEGGEHHGGEGEPLERALWGDVRGHVLGFIKTGGTPRSLKIVLAFPKADLESASPLAKALFLNISYEGGCAFITTGFQAAAFTLDKSAEDACDAYALSFLKNAGITAEAA